MLDQTAKIHRLYRLGRLDWRNQAEQGLGRLKAFQQLVVEVVAVRQAQATGSSLEALIGAKSINAEDLAH